MAADRRSRATLALLAALVLVGCDAPTYPSEVPAYDPTELTGGIVYRWAPGRTINVFADSVGAPPGLDMAEGVRTAAARWNDATRYGDYTVRVTASLTEADVIVRFRNAPSRVDLLGCEPSGGGAGRTVFCTDASPAAVLPLLGTGGGRVKMEVYVDPASRTAEQLAPIGLTPQTYFLALLTHEMGHVLGIGGHSPEITDVMNSFPRVTAPSARDVQTLRAVWRRAVELLL